MPKVNFHIHDHDLARIQARAAAEGVTFSEAMRRAVALHPASRLADASGGAYSLGLCRAVLDAAEALANKTGWTSGEDDCIGWLGEVDNLLSWLGANPYNIEAQGRVAAVFEALPQDVREALAHQAGVLTELAKLPA